MTPRVVDDHRRLAVLNSAGLPCNRNFFSRTDQTLERKDLAVTRPIQRGTFATIAGPVAEEQHVVGQRAKIKTVNASVTGWDRELLTIPGHRHGTTLALDIGRSEARRAGR